MHLADSSSNNTLPDRAATAPRGIELFSSVISDEVDRVFPKLNSTPSKEEGSIPEEEEEGIMIRDVKMHMYS
jgi:hypothetical protein